MLASLGPYQTNMAMLSSTLQRRFYYAMTDVLPFLAFSKNCAPTIHSYAFGSVRLKSKSESLRTNIFHNSLCLPLPRTSIKTKPSMGVNFMNFSSKANNKCWHCEIELLSCSQFCKECGKLQAQDRTLNYFEILGVKQSFSVDTRALTKLFRKLQAKFHPDKYSLSDKTENEYALDHSSAINKAYQVLQHPVERALYLLELAGQPLHEGQIDMDPEFLMEIMEVNEELAEATDKEAVASIGLKNQEILNRLLQEADEAFSADDLKTARAIVAKIKYYNNIYLKIREYERQHGILD